MSSVAMNFWIDFGLIAASDKYITYTNKLIENTQTDSPNFNFSVVFSPNSTLKLIHSNNPIQNIKLRDKTVSVK